MSAIIRAVFIFAVFSTCGHAQTIDSAVSRSEQDRRFRANVPLREDARKSALTNDQVPSSPGDADLGDQVLLKRREKATPFRIFGDFSAFYTSNAALTDRRVVEDTFIVGQIGASYQPCITNSLFADFTVREAAFRYNKLSEFDFESLNLGAGLTYVARPLWNIAFSARYNYNRLTDGSQHDEFLSNHTLTFGLLKTFEITKAHYFYAGYASLFGWSEPTAPERDEHGLFLGYHANLTRSIGADLFYRIAYFNYSGGRDDLNQNLVASLKWDVTRWFNVSASTSFGLNDSNRDVFDYKVFNTGLSLSASFVF